MTTNAFLTVPARMGRRSRRVRPEHDPRLAVVEGFDSRNPWIRTPVQYVPGYARIHPVHPDRMEWVGDDGTASVLSVSRRVRSEVDRLRGIRGFGPSGRDGKGGSHQAPPPLQTTANDWWARVDESGVVTQSMAPAWWVTDRLRVRDRDAERIAKRHATRQARIAADETPR